MSLNVNHGQEDGLEEFSETEGTGGNGFVCEPWSSLLSSEDSSTTGVDVLGSYAFVAIRRPEIFAY